MEGYYPDYLIHERDSRYMKIYPYQCVIRNGVFDEAVNYVTSTFEDGTYRWKDSTFFFKNEKDAMWFKLKWC